MQNYVFERKISSLIATQFPEFYRESGPVFVAFVKEYYRWLEQDFVVADSSRPTRGYIEVNAKSANIIGHGTTFSEIFPSQSKIAIYKQDSTTDYQLFTVNAVANNTFLTLSGSSNTLPDFSSSNSLYRTTKDQFNPNYYLRRFPEDKDIDLTADQFLVYFKEKYLKNIQFDTKADIKKLLKHSLDIYRSKGTERSLDLVFRAVFGTPTRVYYPKDDIFRLSDGKWFQPTYLELSLKKNTDKLIGKQIVGALSGAEAFAEALVRRTVKNRIVDLLYISAVKGEFMIDEPINSVDGIIDIPERPHIVGSLTTVDVDQSGTGSHFSVGDIVDLLSDWGEQGRAKVAAVTNTTGQVGFSLENGGYGYRSTSNVLVSDEMMIINNLKLDDSNISGKDYVYVFDGAVQPLANVSYDTLSNVSAFAAGSNVYAYDANDDVSGTGIVLSKTDTSNTVGVLLISVLTGNLDSNTLYSESNDSTANVASYDDVSATANVIGYYANVSFNVYDKNGDFTASEEIYQLDEFNREVANGIFLSYSSVTGSSGVLRSSNTIGVFRSGKTIQGRTSGANATVNTASIIIGVISVNNTFTSFPNNYIYFSNSLSNGTVTSIGQGSLANVGISANLLYTENVASSEDFIRDYTNVAINATAYGFPHLTTANLSSGNLGDVFSNTAFTVGKIQALTGINRGSEYSLAPIVKVYDSVVETLARQDIYLEVQGVEGIFTKGELVTQSASNARGLVKSANDSVIYLEQLRVDANNDFVATTNSTTTIKGETSQATGNVISNNIDPTSQYLGFNAVIDTEVQTAPGAVTDLIVINSGFGYQKADSLRFVKSGNSTDDPDAGTALANLQHQGMGEGYYKVKGGFLSDQKKLFDGIYYQDFSYEIRSSVLLNKYEDMLKKLLHLAGTKYFGAFVYSTSMGTPSNIEGAMADANTASELNLLSASIDIDFTTNTAVIANTQ